MTSKSKALDLFSPSKTLSVFNSLLFCRLIRTLMIFSALSRSNSISQCSTFKMQA